MPGKCEHGLTTKECLVCATPKYGAPKRAQESIAEAIDRAVAAERERCAKIVEDTVRMVDGAEALAAIRGPKS